MSYDQKIQSARKVIDEHNANAEKQVNFEKFTKDLIELGGSSEGALKSVSWEDLQECGLPRILARSVSNLFRKGSDNGDSKSAYVSAKKIAMFSNKELVEHYNPKDVKNPVGKRLKDLSDGKKFIVFDDNNKVIIDETVKLLEDIINGLPEVETAFVEKRPLQTYSIGERPDFYVEENPVYPRRALRSGEVCDQTGRSWKDVDLETRQLIYLAIYAEELFINSISDAHDIIDKILSKDCSLDDLRARYPVASKTFDAKRKVGQLPLLKIKVGGNSVESKNNNPFGNNSTY
jgi:hypothetical protein